MMVSGIYANLRFSGQVLSASAIASQRNFSKQKGYQVRFGAKSLRSDRGVQAHLTALASCLVLAVSGCVGAVSVAAAAGKPSPQSSPQLTISAASLGFGSTTVNTPTIQSLTL